MPVNDTVCETGTAVFTITASGQNLSYAWTKNGLPIGVNSNILTIDNVGPADNGNSIVCTVSSTCGGPVVSTPVKLIVLPATTITTQPSDAVRCTNGSVSITVVAAGAGLSYQWKKGGVDLADIPGKMSGSKSSSLLITNLVAADAGSYTCYVSGSCGFVTSNPANIQVNDPIVVTTQPTNKNACAGDNIIFSTVATGTNLTYQWYFDNGGGPAPIAGATSSNYPINGLHRLMQEHITVLFQARAVQLLIQIRLPLQYLLLLLYQQILPGPLYARGEQSTFQLQLPDQT